MPRATETEGAVQPEFVVGSREAVLDGGAAKVQADDVFAGPCVGLEVGDEQLILSGANEMPSARLVAGRARGKPAGDGAHGAGTE